jgi:transposase
MMKKAATLAPFGKCHSLGIDVSKDSLDLVGIDSAGVWRIQLANQNTDIEPLARLLVKAGYRGKIICESTGHYHLLLALVFSRYGLDLRVVNPLQSSKHQTARIRKTKTDPVDGYVLATMCTTERDLPKAANLAPKQVLARLKQGQLQSLDKQIQRLSRSLDSYSETYEQLNMEIGHAFRSLEQALQQLRAAKRQLEAELEQAYLDNAQAEEVTRLGSIPGYSPLVSSMVAGAFDREVKSERSWIAFSGMDISIRQSGKWVGRGRLTKRGNSFFRKRLYGAAWGAMMNYPEVRQYYDKLKAEGRHHVEALCIIARKLLRIAYAVLVKGKTYDSRVAFPA